MKDIYASAALILLASALPGAAMAADRDTIEIRFRVDPQSGVGRSTGTYAPGKEPDEKKEGMSESENGGAMNPKTSPPPNSTLNDDSLTPGMGDISHPRPNDPNRRSIAQ
jgi:hypothetical protein